MEEFNDVIMRYKCAKGNFISVLYLTLLEEIQKIVSSAPCILHLDLLWMRTDGFRSPQLCLRVKMRRCLLDGILNHPHIHLDRAVRR